MKNFAILSFSKLKTLSSVANSGKHTFREVDTPNANLQIPNMLINRFSSIKSSKDLKEAVEKKLPQKRRKDAVLCLEFMVSASPEVFEFWDKQQLKKYFVDSLNFIYKRFGQENLVYAMIHMDEKSPHLVAYSVPLVDGKLNCKYYTGGIKKCSEIQTAFYEEVGKPNGLIRGVEKSGATHEEMRTFYGRINRVKKSVDEDVKNNVKRDLGNGDVVVSLEYLQSLATVSYAAVHGAIKHDTMSVIASKRTQQAKDLFAKLERVSEEVMKKESEVLRAYRLASIPLMMVEQKVLNKIFGEGFLSDFSSNAAQYTEKDYEAILEAFRQGLKQIRQEQQAQKKPSPSMGM